MDLKEIFTDKVKRIMLNAILKRNTEYFEYYNSNYETSNEEAIIKQVEVNKN